jgi:hypothetical protein
MSEPPHKIGLFGDQRFFFPPCRPASACGDWDERDLEGQCSTLGCQNSFKVEFNVYSDQVQPKLKEIGDCVYNSRIYFAVLGCFCHAPVCDNCSAKGSTITCRICGERGDIIIVYKRLVFDYQNESRRFSNRYFWMMTHTDANKCIEKNLGPYYSDFVNYYRGKGWDIDIRELNSHEMCKEMDKFKYSSLEEDMTKKLRSNCKNFLEWLFVTRRLAEKGVINCSKLNPAALTKYIAIFYSFCLNRFFLISTTDVMRRIAPRMSIYNSQFQRFISQSTGIVGSLEFFVFRKKYLNTYRLFGFIMKMIEKLAQPSVVLLGRQQIPYYFRMLYSRIIKRLCKI